MNEVALNSVCIRYTSLNRIDQQKGNTIMPDLTERLVNVSGENTVTQEPAPKPPLNAPPPQSVSQQIVANVTQLCALPAIH
jgi:hypothetical protein